ncbi:MAG: RluA family pseudouridine synthase [Lachnospiraceae bacterium]|nr:RluA family pseudouridine synthase [Lachnospiraceae bacterium]
MDKVVGFKVTEEFEGERIDKVIAELYDPFSRSFIQKIISMGNVTASGKVVKASQKVSQGMDIEMTVPDLMVPNIEPEDIPLDILYEDEDVIVVNKPKGMVVHPAAGHYSGTLVNALMYHCKDSLSGINGIMRPGIVHRIDKDTTGSIIACKNDNAHISIAEQLKNHSINRVYHAICAGVIKDDEGTINSPIGRNPKDRKKMATPVADGKEAITHYKVLQRFKDYTYVECKLETGRTHQIRVHMASINHPLLGDEVYSSRKWEYKTEGQTLHAKILGFVHPVTGEYVETDAPLPDYFTKLLTILR